MTTTLPITKVKLREFFKRLDGPEGINAHKDAKGVWRWRCGGGMDKKYAKRILKKMGYSPATIASLVALFDRHGGHCDCEILLNAEPEIMAPTKRRPRKK